MNLLHDLVANRLRGNTLPVLSHVVSDFLNFCVQAFVVLGFTNSTLTSVLVGELASRVVSHLLLETLLVRVPSLLAASRHDSDMLLVLAKVHTLADHFC